MNVALYLHEPGEARRIVALLESGGARCESEPSVEALMHATHHGAFDVAVIDTREHRDPDAILPAWMRGRASTMTALVLLSADPRPDASVRALDAGADDVVHAPIDPALLVARIRAVHRRARRSQLDADAIHLAGFRLDRNSGEVTDGGRLATLTPREFALAWFLFSRPCRFASREAISMAVWGHGADISDHTMEQHVYMLRKKLRLGTTRGVWIRAAYGRGYRLEVAVAPARAPVDRAPHGPALALAHNVENFWALPPGHS